MDSHAVYSRLTLSIYDYLVHAFSNRFIWGCPTRCILDLYQDCISTTHLELGVGTGFFLGNCSLPERTELTLVDLNPDCLNVAEERLRDVNIQLYRKNVLEPLRLGNRKFESGG